MFDSILQQKHYSHHSLWNIPVIPSPEWVFNNAWRRMIMSECDLSSICLQNQQIPSSQTQFFDTQKQRASVSDVERTAEVRRQAWWVCANMFSLPSCSSCRIMDFKLWRSASTPHASCTCGPRGNKFCWTFKVKPDWNFQHYSSS